MTHNENEDAKENLFAMLEQAKSDLNKYLKNEDFMKEVIVDNLALTEEVEKQK